jgi:hypothetical protein
MNRLISADRPIGHLAIAEAKAVLPAICWIDEGKNESPALPVDACQRLEMKRPCWYPKPAPRCSC